MKTAQGVARAAYWLAAAVCAGFLVSFGCQRTPGTAAHAIPVIAQTGTDPQIVAAIEQAKSKVIADPQAGAAWGLLGSTFMAHKFQKQAIDCFREAETLQPNEPRWPYLQGVILLSEDANAAISKLERAAELTGDTPATPKLRLVDALLERGRLDEAEKHLQKVAKQYSSNPNVLLGLGKVALAREQLDLALRYLMESAESAATARTSLALLAGILQRQGNAAAAAEASRRLALAAPDPEMIDPFLAEVGALQTGMQAWLSRAEGLSKKEQWPESLALLQRTVATYPDSGTAWRMLGQAQVKQRDYAGAEASLRKAAALVPGESVTHYQLGTVLGATGRFREAAESFRETIRLRPTDAAAHFHLGQCLSREGKASEAIDAYRAAVRYDPTFAAAWSQLGASLGKEGRIDEAAEALARAVKLNPADAEAVRNLKEAQRLRDSK